MRPADTGNRAGEPDLGPFPYLERKAASAGNEPMNITRQQLAQVVAEEVARRLRELHEAGQETEAGPDDEEEGGEESKSSKRDVVSADTEKPAKGKAATGPKADTGSPDASALDDSDDTGETGHSVDGDEPDPEAIDPEGTDGEEGGGQVNDFVQGKTVQSVALVPKSKILPGAHEVVFSFNETTEPLKLLITPTGTCKFLVNGALMDLP